MNAPILRQESINHSFNDVWNSLSHSQKIIIFKLGLAGWQLDYSLCDMSKKIAQIIHYNGKKGSVNFFGEVNFFN
jgi:hypothetical protein